MLLNLPANSVSRTCSASWSIGRPATGASHPLRPSPLELKPGMFMIRMPSSAKPRRMSSVGMRSAAGSEPGVPWVVSSMPLAMAARWGRAGLGSIPRRRLFRACGATAPPCAALHQHRAFGGAEAVECRALAFHQAVRRALDERGAGGVTRTCCMRASLLLRARTIWPRGSSRSSQIAMFGGVTASARASWRAVTPGLPCTSARIVYSSAATRPRWPTLLVEHRVGDDRGLRDLVADDPVQACLRASSVCGVRSALSGWLGCGHHERNM